MMHKYVQNFFSKKMVIPLLILCISFISFILVGEQTLTPKKVDDKVYVDSAVKGISLLQGNQSGIFHLFSHGRPGELFINGEWINTQQIADFLKSKLQKNQHINIYGCEFGKGETGKQAVDYLETALGVSIAASDDITGKDGDWDLEVGNPKNVLAIKGYQGNLQAMNIVPTSNISPVDFVGYRDNATNPTGPGILSAIAINNNNIIAAGGAFDSYFNNNTNNGKFNLNFHQLNFDQATTFNSFTNATITGASNNVTQILALRSGSFLVGVNTGNFFVYRVDANGTVTSIMNQTYGGIMIEDPLVDNLVYISSTYSIFRYNVGGGANPSPDPNWEGVSGTSSGVANYYDMAFSQDGKLLVAQYTQGLSAYDRTTGAKTRLVSALTNTNAVLSVAVQSDGKIVFGGRDMTDAALGLNRAYLARLNPNFTLDGTFATHSYTQSRTADGALSNSSQGAMVNEIEIGPSDDIYIASNFSHLQNYESIGSLCRLSKDGVLDQTFIQNFRLLGNGDNVGNMGIQDMKVQPDDKILIVGGFAGANDLYHAGLMRVRPDGILDVQQYNGTSPGTSQLGLNVLLCAGNRNSHGVIYRKGEEASYNVNGYHPSYYGRTNDDFKAGYNNVPSHYDAAADKFIVAYPTNNVTNERNIVCHNLDGTIRWSKQPGVNNDIPADGIPWTTDISHDGNYYVVLFSLPGGGSYQPRLYNANTGALIKTLPASGYYDVGFNKTGNYFYVLNFGTMHRYDVTASTTQVGATINANNPYNNPGSWTIYTHFEFYTDTDLYLFSNPATIQTYQAIHKKILVTSAANQTPNTAAGTYLIYDPVWGVANPGGWTGTRGIFYANGTSPGFKSFQNASFMTVGPDGTIYINGVRMSNDDKGPNVFRIGAVNSAPDTPDMQGDYILTVATSNVAGDASSNQNLLDWGAGWSCNAGTTAPTLNGGTASNICPATTVDLTTQVSSTAPSGSHIVWSTSATASSPSDTLTNITAVTTGTYYAYYYDPVNQCFSPASSSLMVNIAPCCSDPLKQTAECDYDGDGIQNSLDLDDDNDGILDTNESCYDTEFAGNNSNPTGTPSAVFLSYPNNTSASLPNQSNLNFINTGVTSNLTFGSGISATWQASASFNVTAIAATTLTEAITNNEYLQFSFTTNSSSFDAYLDWIGFLNRVNTNPKYTTTYVASNDGFGSNSTILGTISQVAGEGGGVFPIGRRALDIVDYNILPSTTYTIRIYLYDLGGSSVTLNWDDAIIAFDYCLGDTDGDGISNHFDLDRDGDGCPDAIEGGSNFTTNDLVASPMPGGSTNVNTTLCISNICVDANGVPSAVGSSGQIVGNSANSAINDCCPAITSGSNTQPTNCLNNGSIKVCGLLANSNGWTVNYNKDGNPVTPLTNQSADASGCITISGLGGGSYTNIKVSSSSCSTGSNALSSTLTDTTCDTDGDGTPDSTDPAPTNPCVGYTAGSEDSVGSMWSSSDCDGDGVPNGIEVDTNQDGTRDPDLTDPYNACSLVLSEVSLTATSTGDCDGDGVTNANEINSSNPTTDPRTNPTDPCAYNEAEQGTPSAAWNSADCDNDGNPNGTDPNPLTPTAVNDALTAPVATTSTVNVLTNDDFLPGATTSITQTGGTAGGTVSFNPMTGVMSYTPLSSEAGTTKTVVYQVCNTTPNPDVCAAATVTITIPADPDTDGDGTPDSTDPAPTNPCVGYTAGSEVSVGSMWSSADCDGDGVPNGIEVDTNQDGTRDPDLTDPYNPCSLVLAEVSLTATSTGDCDGDGVTNANEINSTNPTTDPRTNPTDPCAYNKAEQGTPSAAWNSADCDNDGNPNGTDPNPLAPTAVNDALTAPVATTSTVNVLTNDDFLPGATTSITRTGGTAGGTVSFNPMTGVMSYTPLPSEAGTTKTVVYQVCNTTPNPDVCATATVTITIPADPDTDGDGTPDSTDPAPTNPCVGYTAGSEDSVGSMWSSADCDGDGVPNGIEVDTNQDGTRDPDLTDPYNPCSLVLAEVSLTATSTGDCDGDGVTNANEINSTNPTTDPRTNPTDPCAYNKAEQGTPSAAWNSADCDNDGNPNGTDPNPLAPTAVNDALTAPVATTSTVNVLTNDDYLPGATTSITRTGGTAGGTVSFNPMTGVMSYTPLASEAGTTKTVVYQVCNTTPNPDVCATATVTITIPADPDTDGDGTPDSTDPAPTNPCVGYTAGSEDSVGSMWSSADCDGDGVPNGIEVDTNQDGTRDPDLTDPYNACSLVLAEVSLTATSTGDCDGDGVTNANEINSSNPTTDPRTNPTDPCAYNEAEQGTPSAAWNSADCDNDGNPNGTDPNPLTPTAVNDALTAPVATTSTVNVLTNDDFLPGANTSITQTGGTAGGTVSFNPMTGVMSYTPLASEAGTTKTVVYQVCNTTPNPDVCATATVTITVGAGNICVTPVLKVMLEGPYVDNGSNGTSMTTKLNNLGYLPGQQPSTFFGIATPVGQPYNVAPWNYTGAEGTIYDKATAGPKAGYPTTTTDWVLVSLRESSATSSTVCTKAALLLSDGTIQIVSGFDCCNIDITKTYYIVVEHRNHLIVMSHIKVPVVGTSITYDFTTQQSYKGLLGYGQKLINGKYVMYAGNGQQSISSSADTDINVNDKDAWLNQNGNNSSYYINDFELNGDVNVQDKNLWLINNGKFSDVPRD